MANEVLYVDKKDYFDMRKFEDSISNAGIVKQKKMKIKRSLRIFDKLLVLIFIAILLFTAFVCIKVLFESLKIREKNKQISKLEVTLDKKILENDEMIDDIRGTVQGDNLKVKAYLDLNMVMPTEKNIIYFDKSDSEYVRQYENIRE